MLQHIPLPIILAGLAILSVRLIVSGFVTKSGLFAWPMFSHMAMTAFHVVDQWGKPVDQWDHLIHADIGMTRPGAELFLEYLSESKGIVACGEATFFDEHGIWSCKIEGSAIVTSDEWTG